MTTTIKIHANGNYVAEGNLIVHTHANGPKTHIVSNEMTAISVGPNAEKTIDVPDGTTVEIKISERPAE